MDWMAFIGGMGLTLVVEFMLIVVAIWRSIK